MKCFMYNMKSNEGGHLLGIKTMFVEHSSTQLKVNWNNHLHKLMDGTTKIHFWFAS